MTSYPDVAGPDPGDHPALAGMIQSLRQRHNNAICGVLVYGSCLRSGDIYDGLLDLYALCDSYRDSYGDSALALANWLLPPNVFYAEQDHDGRTLRCKVTVISIADFRRGCSRAWFQSYIWGRFAQPTYLAYARDAETRSEIEQCLLEAVRTLLLRALPVLPPEGTLEQLWEEALTLSYDTELRTERSGRTRELVQSARTFYEAVTRYHADSLAFGFALYDQGDQRCYRFPATASQRARSRGTWLVRRWQGKALSILRLVKALFTFEGGLDYIAWKLERHSGEAIEIPARVRRYPLIHMWGFFWGLYRRGVFK